MAYSPLILSAAGDLDSIRNLLGVGSADVADAIVLDTPYLPLVEAEVTASIAGYAALTGGNLYRLKTGAAAWCAALLCGYLEGVQANSVGDGAFTVGDYTEKPGAAEGSIDYTVKAAELVKRAAEALAAITTRVWTRPSLIKFAGPQSRSDKGVPTDYEGWIEKIQPRFLDALEEGDQEDDDY